MASTYDFSQTIIDNVSDTATVAVLLEHQAFLRDQLEVKRHWFEEALAVEKQKTETLTQALTIVYNQRDKLRVALAGACKELRYHNCSDDYSTESDDIDRWEELLQI
jgi:hypothetical protein